MNPPPSPAATTAPPPPCEIDVLDPRFYDDPWEAYRWLRQHSPDPLGRQERAVGDLPPRGRVAHLPQPGALLRGRRRAAEGAGADVDHLDGRPRAHPPAPPHQPRLHAGARCGPLTDHIRELSNQIIDEVAERGELDFVEDFAIHVPLIVIAEMMGLDPEQRDQLYQWSDAMMAGDGARRPRRPGAARARPRRSASTPRCAASSSRSGAPTPMPATTSSPSSPRPSTRASSLVTTAAAPARCEVPDGELTDDELLMFLVLIVVAGNETTRNALTGGLLAFSRLPRAEAAGDRRPRRCGTPPSTRSSATCRRCSPSPAPSPQDHTYKGVDFKAGDKVFMLYQSANRDEDVFDAPDELRVDRNPNPHLAFGIGTHYCLGANLARAEVRVVFEELFKRLSDIHVPAGAARARGAARRWCSRSSTSRRVFTPEPASADGRGRRPDRRPDRPADAHPRRRPRADERAGLRRRLDAPARRGLRAQRRHALPLLPVQGRPAASGHRGAALRRAARPRSAADRSRDPAARPPRRAARLAVGATPSRRRRCGACSSARPCAARRSPPPARPPWSTRWRSPSSAGCSTASPSSTATAPRSPGLIRGQVFALVVEHLALGAVTPRRARARAEELAAIVFPR